MMGRERKSDLLLMLSALAAAVVFLMSGGWKLGSGGLDIVLRRFDVSLRNQSLDRIASVAVRICGEETRLQRWWWTRVHRGKVKLDCGKASGVIVVRFDNGRRAECEIGYAVEGFAQRYDLKPGGCSPR